ncbi:MAG TPA: hypothetical protein VMS60_05775 [Solirubrobacterales bacterium]|nr:hypothetical protein [Solirubrobacterales bacterium]
MLGAFDCGPETYETEVAKWIRDWIWSKPKAQEKTIIGLDRDAEDAIVGYGTWEHVEAFLDLPADTHIEIAWFGVASAYKGVEDPEGNRAADLLYATLEGLALSHPDSSEDMPFTLTCHVDNIRGRRFWERQGYQLIGPPYAEVEKDRYHRMVR